MRNKPLRDRIAAGLVAGVALVGFSKIAERRYRQMLAVDGDQPAALIAYGRLLARQRRFGEAIPLWERAIAAHPAARLPPYQLARALARTGRYVDAAAAYLRVLEREPNQPRAFAGLELTVERLLRGGRGVGAPAPDDPLWQRAEEVFRVRLDREPANPQLRGDMARVFAATGRYDEALTIWADLAASAPRSFAYSLEIARIKQQRAHPDAGTALRAALTLNPRSQEALRRTAQLLSRTRATAEDALSLWRDIAVLDRHSAFPLVQQALIYERTGRDDDAEAMHREALAAAPADPLALISLARFYARLGRWREARAQFDRLHQVAPKRIDALIGLGRCDERLGDVTAAEAEYRRAVKLDSRHVTATIQLGRLLRRVGRIAEAIELQRGAAGIAPTDSVVWHELVYLLASIEREDEALAELDRAEAALGTAPDALAQLGSIADAAQFFDRAESYFARAIAAEPDNPRHHAQFGEYYRRQGMLDAALRHLLDSRDRDPKNVGTAAQLVETVGLLRRCRVDPIALRRGRFTGGSVLMPERLFGMVRDIALRDVPRYVPESRRIIAVSASLAPGGAERQLATLLRELKTPQYEVDISLLCVALGPLMRRDFFLSTLTESNIAVTAPEPSLANAYLNDPAVVPFADLLRWFPNEMVAPAAFWLAEFARRRPMVVHAWQDSTNLTAAVAALLAGVPRIVLSTRSVRPDNPRRRLKRYMREAYQAVLGHPSVILCNNSRAGAADYADWLGIDAANIEITYNGIDFAALHRGVDDGETRRLRASIGIPMNVPVLGSVFRMSEEKRPLLWVETAAAVARRLPLAHFVVCGEGPMFDDMIARAAELGIADRFHLPGTQNGIAAWYRMMDVVLLTSRHEGLPNILLEAQSCGIPVVAPAVGGVPETLLDGVTGWAVPDADAERLADRIAMSLSDRTWRETARITAPNFVSERFSVAAMVRRHLEIYGITPSV